MKKRFYGGFGLILLLLSMNSASAHPMGNYSISHYMRLRASGAEVRLLYLLDFAEVPTLEEMDTVADGIIQPEERDAFLRENLPRIQKNLRFTCNGTEVRPQWGESKLVLRPGSGALVTAFLRLEGVLSLPRTAQRLPQRVTYEDANYPERLGWREIVAEVEQGYHLEQSNVSNLDRSLALTRYPTVLDNTTPQEVKASFTVVVGLAPTTSTSISPKPIAAANNERQDAFTHSITTGGRSPLAVLIACLIAFCFGAGHALSPGHGKAMVASYLVGVRGTPRHALLLGLVVTMTHTLGVYLLGLVAMFASRYMLSERLLSVLSLLSGLAVLGVGGVLLVQRVRAFRLSSQSCFAEDADNRESEESTMDPSAEVSFWELLLLGMSGGALPCPTALVVMLSAIALRRIAFGVLLILVFSLGLASVLTLIGILTLRLKRFGEVWRSNPWLSTRLPILSAVLVTGIGLYLVLLALNNLLHFRV